MASRPAGSIGRLLNSAARDAAAAWETPCSASHPELRRLARAQLAQEPQDCSLQPTSLIHETYERLVGEETVEWADRRRFFAAAAETMRRILLDDACYRGSLKRDGGRPLVPPLEEPAAPEGDRLTLLAITQALEKLERVEPLGAEVVKLRYFAALSVDDTAGLPRMLARAADATRCIAKARWPRELSNCDAT